MTRSTIAALAFTVLACAQATPAPADPPVSGTRPAAVEVSGTLTRKGPDETSFWAITDGAGKVWEVVEVTPQLDARFRRVQNGPVTVLVERKGRSIFEQIRVIDVARPAP
jgi:hypothetical protein